MVYVIDRIEGGIAVCESLETEDNLEIPVADLPKEAKEGDVIRKGCRGYAIDAALTKRRKEQLSDRLNRLFNKSGK